MRRGGHERPSRLLLAVEALLHHRQRPREVSHLVARPVDRDLYAGAFLGEFQRRLAQRAQPADQAARQGDAEDQRQRQPGEGGVEERPSDDRHRVSDLVDRLARGQHVHAGRRFLNGIAAWMYSLSLIDTNEYRGCPCWKAKMTSESSLVTASAP